MIRTTVLLLGMWRATLMLPDATLPFTFEVKQQAGNYYMEIINGTERMKVDEIKTEGDSVFITLPVFGTEIRAYSINGLMRGNFINATRKVPMIPFEAYLGNVNRFELTTPANALQPQPKIAGRYEVHFSKGTADSSTAVGLFEQNGNNASGTFLTATGDYRYLDGVVDGDSLKLSCFDGVHLFLFLAKQDGDKLSGMFYSGNHWKEPWTAIRNDKAELPDLDKLTFMKKGFTKVDFRFPDLDSNMVTLSDARFKNKVCVIQIMGSWCPNCMDETAFLSPFYNRYKNKNFEVIGLSFEKYPEFKKAAVAVNRVKEHFDVQYPLLIAGIANKESVGKALPMLNNFMGYPTTIIIDKKGTVRKIHTGFTGPATGIYYDRYSEEFENFIQKLLRE